ncbi:MAG: class E sortase [Actinomycetota bacterium]|nr:class E sortase [Actinomycetota bacterium]
MVLRRAIGGFGRLLIALGTVVLLFVAYQLWGTGLREAQAQSELTEEFSEALVDEEVPRGNPPLPQPGGGAVAIIRIPKIGVEKAVVEGVGVPDLKKGPGHYPGTPLPGQGGNAAIAGHRTTYGAPFFELDRLVAGDEILVRTVQGEFRYAVDRSMVVRPTQVEVLDPTEEARLTLTTCNPRYSARERLIVSAVLLDDPVPAPDPVEAPPPELVSETVDGAALSGDPSARVPALLWGALAAGAWVATVEAARRWRRLPAYLLGAPVVLVVLFVCFEHVARLFPANI